MINRKFWLFSIVVTGTLLILSSLPPFVPDGVRLVLMRAFSFTCHQIPERSPHIHSVALTVCFRCYGIYWGLMLGTVVFGHSVQYDGYFDRNARWIITASITPAAIDWLGGVAGFWESGGAVRFVTGLIFGNIAGYFLARALSVSRRHHNIEPVAPSDVTSPGRTS